MNEILIIATTLFLEAAGEPFAGKIAVAGVIQTRAEERGMTFAEVCLQPKQFSSWNRGVPAVMADYHAGKFIKDAPSREALETCFEIARMLKAGEVPRVKWNHYWSCKIKTPTWAKDCVETARIGNHIFAEIY